MLKSHFLFLCLLGLFCASSPLTAQAQVAPELDLSPLYVQILQKADAASLEPVLKELRILLARLNAEEQKQLQEKLVTSMAKLDLTHLLCYLLFKTALPVSPTDSLSLKAIPAPELQGLLLTLSFLSALARNDLSELRENDRLHEELMEDGEAGVKIFAQVYESLRPYQQERRWLGLHLSQLAVYEKGSELLLAQQESPTWQGVRVLFDEAGAMLFSEWETRGGDGLRTGLRRWFPPLEKSTPSVGAHPAFFYGVREKLKQSLVAETLQKGANCGTFLSRGAYAYLKWLSLRVVQDTGRTKMILPLLLEIALQNPASALPPGDFPPSETSPAWEGGPCYWKEILRPALEAVVNRYDARPEGTGGIRQAYPEEIRDLANFPGWNTGTPVSTLEAVRSFGKWRMVKAWKKYEENAAQRAKQIEGSFVAQNALPADGLKRWVAEAQGDRETLAPVSANPWCNPWLPLAGRVCPPSSLESGVFLRWLCAHLPSAALALAIDREWAALLESGNMAREHHGQKLSSLDLFDPWECLRGRFSGQQMAGENPGQVYETIEGDAALLRLHWERLSAWRSAVKKWQEQGGEPPRLTRAERTSLALFCYLGLPLEGEGEMRAVLAKLPEPSADETAFFRACCAHLAISSVLAGQSLGKAWPDSVLWGSDSITGLPGRIAQLYDDGRPFSVRAAIELAWLFSYQALLRDPFWTLAPLAQQSFGEAILSPLLVEVSQKAHQGQLQGGLGLALWEVAENLTAAAQAKSRLGLGQPALLPNGRPGRALGKDFWGIVAGLDRWQRELQAVREARLLSINPVKNGETVFQIRDSWRCQLGVQLALLSGHPSPQLSRTVLLRREMGEAREGDWQELGVWAHFLKKEGEFQGSREDFPIPITCVPWKTTPTPQGMLEVLVDRAASLESATQKIAEEVELDGLNARYLPSRTWKNCREGLAEEIRQIEKVETSIQANIQHLELKIALDDLKALLSAPLVLDLASFREEMSASIAEVRAAESALAAARHESLAAEMELLAQNLLTRVAELEIERTNVLLEIQKNEEEHARLEMEIRATEEEMARLRRGGAENAEKIAGLEEQKKKLDVEKAKIEVGLAAKAVVALLHQVKLLEDLLVTPYPAPHHPHITVTGRLGVLAYQAEEQVRGQLQKIEQEKGRLQSELDKLREGGCIRGVCRFVGIVVGTVVGSLAGNPFLGAALGNAIGGGLGELIDGIRQKKSLDEIAIGLMDDGLAVAQVAGLDLAGKLNNLGSASGHELGKSLEEFEKVTGPIFKELPAFLSQPVIKEALEITGVGDPLGKVLGNAQSLLSTLQEGPGQLGGLGTAFQKSVQEVALSGKPEEMLGKIEKHLLGQWRNQMGFQLQELQSAARELGVQVERVATARELQEQIAHKVALLVMARAVDKMSQKRDEVALKLMSWISQFQKTLKEGEFHQISKALATVCQSIPHEEKDTAQEWLRSLFANVPINPHQELPWGVLERQLRPALEPCFPEAPDTLELIVGQFQLQLDTQGYTLQIQELVEPWNKALQKKLAGVQAILDRPVGGGNQQQQIGQQISHLNEAGQKLQSDVLQWLRNPNPESEALRQKLTAKVAELETARENLATTKITLEQGQISVQQARLEIANAKLGVEIAKLAQAIASLSSQQTAIAWKNAQLKMSRSVLLKEQDLLRRNLEQMREEVLKARLAKRRAEVDQAAARLDVAVAQAQGARNRGLVLGKLEGWYQRVRLLSYKDLSLRQLEQDRDESRDHLEQACAIVREMLRILRVSGGDSSPFPLPGEERWASYLQKIASELQKRMESNAEPRVGYLTSELSPTQIKHLFSEKGLTLYITHQPPELLPEIDRNLLLWQSVPWLLATTYPYTQAEEDTIHLPISPQRHQRVFMMLLMAGDKAGTPNDPMQWRFRDVEHDALSPVLEERIEHGTTRYESAQLLCKEKMRNILDPWPDQLPLQPLLPNQTLPKKEVIGEVRSRFEIQQILVGHTLTRSGMPLTGRSRFQIVGKPPERAILTLVFTYQP